MTPKLQAAITALLDRAERAGWSRARKLEALRGLLREGSTR